MEQFDSSVEESSNVQTRCYTTLHDSSCCRMRLVKVIICPMAIAYSIGQIIKSVCVCQCVSMRVSVRLRALSRSHFMIDFYQNWHRRKNPQNKNEFVRNQYRTTPSPILPPPKLPILGQEILKTHANIK